jgi:hypothetical protein
MKKSEASIQQEIVRWYKNTYCLNHHIPRCMIFSIPNEGRGAQSAKLIQTGLYPGCADLFLIHKISQYTTYSASTSVFIEVKTETGVQSDKQKQFEVHCNQMGINYFIVRSLKEFKYIITNL